MSKHNLKKGQLYAAKFKGANGDLILGEIKSVRRDGDVILTNLLTGNRSTKSRKVLESRNHLVTKQDAAYIKQAFQRGGKKEARISAVYYWSLKNRPTFGSKEKKAEERQARVKVIRRKRIVKDIRKLSLLLERRTLQLAKLEEE